MVLINCYKAWPTINKTVKRKDEKRYVQFLNLKSIEHYLIRKDSKMYDIYVSQIDKKKNAISDFKKLFPKNASVNMDKGHRRIRTRYLWFRCPIW